MQTKRQIAQLLAAAGVSPNRRLGQHFLVDLNLMRLLLDSAQPGPGDVVLEVGCGTGSLTEALAERAGAVVAVEIDRTLASIVASRLADRDNVELVTGDVLSSKGALNPAVVEAVARARAGKAGRLLLVANLPYDVACPVIVHLVKGPPAADAMFVTVQKEVAERMTAAPGGRHYGSVSILLGATGSAHTLRTLGPGVFWPPPRVDSALVAFTRDETKCRRIGDVGLLRAQDAESLRQVDPARARRPPTLDGDLRALRNRPDTAAGRTGARTIRRAGQPLWRGRFGEGVNPALSLARRASLAFSGS